jgi:L-iditol 2-dehydrogenase
MKAVFVKKGGGIYVTEMDIPEIDKGELLIKMRACGIDGTDLEKAFGKPITSPMLGHEVVGEVIESKSPEFEVGDRVFVHHHVSCGKCYYCLHNSHTMCPLFLKTTIEPCGLAEFFRVPRINIERGAVLKLPPMLDWEEATFIEPAACVLRAIKRVGFKAGESISLLGVGPTGALFIKLLRIFGASSILVSDLSKFRLEIARKLGADETVDPNEADFAEVCKMFTDGRGVDIGILGTPTVKPLPKLIETVRRGGRICIFGAPEKSERIEIDFSSLFINEINIITSYSSTEIETTTILDLIRNNKIRFSDLITHRFEIDEAYQAFEVARDKFKSLKVVIINK